MQSLNLNMELMNRLYKSSSRAVIIHKNIRPKFRGMQDGKLNNVLNLFSAFRTYTFKNLGMGVPDPVLTIAHNAETLLTIAKARRDLKALAASLDSDKAKTQGSNHSYCIQTLDMFESHIRQMISRKAAYENRPQ